MKLRDPRRITLDRVTFHDDLKTISYHFTLDGEQRIVAYHSEREGRGRVGVQEKAGSEPIIQVQASRNGMRARTRQGEFQLVKGRLVLPPETDWRSLWLLAQNPLSNSSLTPKRIYTEVLDGWVHAPGEPEPDSAAGSASMGIALDLIGLLFDLYDHLGGGNCLNPNQQTQCTETDVSGNDTVITFECPCGQPICNQITTSVSVQVVTTDPDTGERETTTEQRPITVCACYCMEISIGTGGPG